MAFGMSPFPLQFGSRGGGAIPPFPLTPDSIADALDGLTFTRSGAADGLLDTGEIYSASGNLPLLHWDAVTETYGLLVRPSRTNYALHSNDFENAAWSKTNITPANGSGYSRLTATDANGTVLQSVTLASGTRVFQVSIRRISGIGNIDLTMDNGSTWTTVTVGSDWTLVYTAQILTNPTIGIRIVASGDVIDVRRAGLAATIGGPYPPALPLTAGATAAVNEERLLRSISQPAEIDVDLAVMAPAVAGALSCGILSIDDGTDSNIISVRSSTPARFTAQHRRLAGSYTSIHSADNSHIAGTLAILRVKFAAGTLSLWLNGGLINEVSSLVMPTVTQMQIGYLGGVVNSQANFNTIVGVRDRKRNLGLPENGWNQQLFSLPDAAMFDDGSVFDDGMEWIDD